MRSGKINIIGILMVVAGTIGGVWLWRFGPYYYDHWEMNEVVKSAARTWKDLGVSHGRGRLLDEMKTRDLPTYLTEDMCNFTELGSRKTVTCEWRVDVAWPLIDRVEKLSFVSTATVNEQGYLE